MSARLALRRGMRCAILSARFRRCALVRTHAGRMDPESPTGETASERSR